MFVVTHSCHTHNHTSTIYHMYEDVKRVVWHVWMSHVAQVSRHISLFLFVYVLMSLCLSSLIHVPYIYISVYICIYMYIYTCMYAFICIYTHIYIYIHMCIYIYTYMYIYTYIYIYIRICIYKNIELPPPCCIVSVRWEHGGSALAHAATAFGQRWPTAPYAAGSLIYIYIHTYIYIYI